MRRAWGLSAALVAASTYACLYLVTLLPLPLWSRAHDIRFHPALAPLRPFVYFVDRSTIEAYYSELRGWVWLPRLVLAVALVFVVHVATHAVAASWARVAVVQAGAVLLAAGLADLVALVIVIARAVGTRGVAVDLAESRVFWTYDALFLGFACSAVVVFVFLLQRLLWTFAGRPSDAFADPVDDGGPSRTGNLALACSLPVVALALLGGAHSYSGKSEQQVRLVDEAADLALHPRLQLRPQMDPDAGFDQVVDVGRWVPGSVSAVLFLVALWLLLRWVLAGVRRSAGAAAVLVVVWGVVVVTSALGAVADAVTGLGSLPLATDLPHATRFGVLWGWLPAVIALVALRRRELSRTPA